METVQLSQPAPRFVHDVKPAMPTSPIPSPARLLRPQYVANLPVRAPATASAQDHDNLNSVTSAAPAATKIMEDTRAQLATGTSVHQQHNQPAQKSALPNGQSHAQASPAAQATGQRKPIAETIIAIVLGVLLSLATVFIFKQQ